jgi:hypothetical protein
MSALDEGELSDSRPQHFTPGIHWIEGGEGPKARPEAVSCIVRKCVPDSSLIDCTALDGEMNRNVFC